MTDQRFGLIAGRYALRDQLGHGGMGRVWLAHDEMLDRDVAIKEVAPPSPLSPEESDLLRFLIFREARAAGRINHPHVVKIFDVVQTERWPWLVMEYVPSVNLQRSVHEDGPLSPVEVAKIGLSILEALVAAHDAGVLHRDVKPDNVLLADDGRVVLGDFGLASVDADGKVTRTGQLGTPQYVAPERARHGISSREADLWSLGATLYAAVEGRSPYGRESVLETLAALAVDEPDPMRLAGPLAPVLSGLLRRNPADRTQPEILAEQLRKVISGEALPPAPTPPIIVLPEPEPPRPSRIRAIVLALIAAAIAAAGAYVLAKGDLFNSGLPNAPAVSLSPAIGTVVGVGLLACDHQPARPATVPINVAPPPEEKPLVDGWEWFLGEPEFRTGVPGGWSYWRSGQTVCFRDPRSSRVLAVVKGRSDVETLPGYTELRSGEVFRVEREWLIEFTYTGIDQSRFVMALFTTNFTVLWSSDTFDTGLTRSYHGVLKGSFRDRAGAAGATPAPSNG
ncbi:hypothetical protein Rhe02_79750 [Rhizocola hellebori]|uniref:non-specific serine/threonine protein kinase n=1 Tax=Rhizocola hellebori TaxID=1392758 RepID=A0A8J3QIB0_9ACTN|nr:serine/threonine-protein kinase [Rhizocola hellebori]GIH09908.1 hypothetical protein Rhe02_79750 [Rhizocola hellebori]